MSDLLRYQVSETVWRVWHKDRPDMSFTVDTHVGLCTCAEGRKGPPAGYGCIHVELARDYVEAKGLPKPRAREVAKQVLKALTNEPFVREVKVTGVIEKKGLVSHIKFDVNFRGKGRPCTLEGRKLGVNLIFRTTYHINLPKAPISPDGRIPDWERMF